MSDERTPSAGGERQGLISALLLLGSAVRKQIFAAMRPAVLAGGDAQFNLALFPGMVSTWAFDRRMAASPAERISKAGRSSSSPMTPVIRLVLVPASPGDGCALVRSRA